ncbi:tetratricopeptide repeat protein, partial [Streptomyces sp. NPDC096311]|uniref:tetratricopeptide repeat protein n=1 Tax=Streptomyces sp. NPDC096311 TaxID=3366083 RepID=UPI0037F5FA85
LTNDKDGQAVAWSNTGSALERLHRYDEALTAYGTARALVELTNDKDGQAVAWSNTGSALERLHRYDEALTAYDTARTLAEQINNKDSQAAAWNGTGLALRGLFRYDAAISAGWRAVSIFKELGDYTSAGEALGELAETLGAADVDIVKVSEVWLLSADAYKKAGASEEVARVYKKVKQAESGQVHE